MWIRESGCSRARGSAKYRDADLPERAEGRRNRRVAGSFALGTARARVLLTWRLMLRITVDSTADAIVRLVVEGQVTEQVAGELQAAHAAHARTGRVVVDLTRVTFADAAGADLLRGLEGQGVILTGCSGFVAELLHRTPAPRASAPCSEDETLVSRLQAGDDDAFAALVQQHGARMLAAARRLLRQEDEARDAVQEAFLSATSAIEGFDRRARLSTWLHRIVVNCALMRLRRRRRRPEQPIDDLLPRFAEDGNWEAGGAQPKDTTHVLLERRETRALVRSCIDQLPETYRTVVMLRDIDELDTKEVADRLGVTTNTVKVRLHRGRQALRTLLERSSARSEGLAGPCPARSLVA
jgi:RNA polymerase sigma-70 factor (ECF subfamily)